jgi:uncharacterized surface protein with fasciclin (FAS1) repeats
LAKWPCRQEKNLTSAFLQHCKNGFVHVVNNVLVPPPPAGKIIELFPSKFSSLILAAKKTDFKKEFENVDYTGFTFFAPTNWAFEKLGPRANAFLFNTEKGLGYLKALLKYHTVLNEVLYSDAYYGPKKDESEAVATGYYHVDLPTVLEGKKIAVDVARYGGLIDVKLNGFIHVSVQDVVAKDGNIHVLSSVLIPPHKHHGEHKEGAEIEVQDLIERLEPFVEESSEYVLGEL